MPDGQVLEFSGVTKRFGAVAAVSDFSARVEPGVVTGFLGPNGAGKTTSLRILLGLVRASEGRATVGGVPYAKLKNPLQTVGAVLEASSFHPGRTAANHLAVYAQAAGLPASRVDEALGTVGLAEVGGRKVGGFSLGMRQRLGLAYALLGDPGVLVLDEPSNGLDPEGIKWMRGLLRQLARQGRTVLVSSHLLTEVQQTADALLIIAQGRLVFQGGLNDLTDPSEYATVVDSPDRAALAAALSAGGVQYEVLRSGLTVRGIDPTAVGALAAQAGVALSALQRRGPALEEVFLDLVNGVRVHASAAGAVDAGEPEPAADDATAAVPAEAETVVESVVGEVAAEDGTASGETDAVEDALPVEDAPAADDDTVDAVADVEPPRDHAAFAVASTGVIEVIPDEAAPADAADDDDADAEPAAEPAEAVAPEGPKLWTWPAEPAASEAAPADAETDGQDTPAPAEVSADADGRDEGPRTESDLEADRFFSSFDEHRDAAAGDSGADAPSRPDHPAGVAAEPEPEPPVEPEPEPEPGPKLWTWESAAEEAAQASDADDANEGGEPR